MKTHCITHYILICVLFPLSFSSCQEDRYQARIPVIPTQSLRFAPERSLQQPEYPSPALSPAGRELVLVSLADGSFSWFDATVENGNPFDYKKRLSGKGNQLMADSTDFPGFARRGLHTSKELRFTKIITGRSVAQITIDGRPGASSGVGFMAADETLMSVILGDNETVKKMGLTHPDIARPLFHLYNIFHDHTRFPADSITGNVIPPAHLIYNGNPVYFKITGSRGWQESIFDDEILGSGHIEIWRDLKPQEHDFLIKRYPRLSSEALNGLIKDLTFIHTGEMVFFYINRYGFYEGHTEYRVDPVTAAVIFGLKSIEEVVQIFGDHLNQYFHTHYTTNP